MLTSISYIQSWSIKFQNAYIELCASVISANKNHNKKDAPQQGPKFVTLICGSIPDI
eukprot:c17988_g1_i1 orf=414-584(-)